MSSRQDDHMDDAEFDAEFAGFLRGEGELARMLAQVPQPEPSSELDSKILADAQAALAQPASANDAVVPEAERQPSEFRSTSQDISRFIRRARAPLGLAATVVIAVSLGVQWHQEPDVAEQVTVPAVPELKKAPAAQKEVEVRIIEEARLPAPAMSFRAPRADMPPAPPPPKAIVMAPPPPAPPAPEIATGGVSPPPNAIAATSSVARSAPPTPVDSRVLAPVAAPVPAMLSAKPEMPAAMAPMPVRQEQLQRFKAQAADVVEDRPSGDARERAWLEKIDDLIKQGRNDEALRSWEDFRKAYPDYAVPDPLKEKLKALAP